MDNENLSKIAREVRRNIVKSITSAKSGHPGGSLSAADIIVTLYFDIMRIDPKNPRWEDRDRFVLSKGHAAPALYAVLAERGYFSKDILPTLRHFGSILQGHPDMKGIPGVDMTTGSLGQGFSAANGMALAGKLDHKDYRVYVMIGDGEMQEGLVWEAAMLCGHYKLDNVTVFLDYNKLQIDGTNDQVMTVEPVKDKWKAFGFNVLEINGHNFDEIKEAVKSAKECKGKPTIIIANTIKGKGVSFMENQVGWHGNAPTEEQLKVALKDLGGEDDE